MHPTPTVAPASNDSSKNDGLEFITPKKRKIKKLGPELASLA
jgi:hypothetical protein